MTRRIHDHALIGEGRTLALVARDGSIDWLCWPRPDGDPVFAAILDEARGGEWRIAPTSPASAVRSYRDDTNILETVYRIPGGELAVIDLVTAAGLEHVAPEQAILRRVECRAGEVEIEHVFTPTRGWGRGPARVRRRGRLGWRVNRRRSTLALVAPVAPGERRLLRAGETLDFWLTLAAESPPVLGGDASAAIRRTEEAWRALAARVRYDGPYREMVVRSALVLMLLVHGPSGSILAASTTSLPERVGGELNWDYRYCWLRDASFTVSALYDLGLREEGDGFVNWLIHATALTHPELRILYDVYGNKPPAERIMPHLAGHRRSRPVRRGNGARDQLQLDVYGEVVAAVGHCAARGGELDSERRRLLRGYGEIVVKRWREPDEGIWETRLGRAHHTHSRLLCWTALDWLVQLGVGRFAGERDRIRAEIETRHWSERKRAYVARLGSEDLDASVILASRIGFHPPDHPRLLATWQAIRRELGAGGPLLRRYLPPPGWDEGAFACVSFWAAEALARAGEVEEATAIFDGMLAYANDVGLFGEEIDPATGEALGNFPQAFTHVGLVGAALELERAVAARRERGAA